MHGVAGSREGDPKTISVTSASSCVECCEGDPLCEALTGLTDLRAAVNDLVPERGLANSLEAKIDAATSAVLVGEYAAAINQLDAFANQVDAAEQSRRMSAGVSNIMKTKHDTVKNSISNIR